MATLPLIWIRPLSATSFATCRRLMIREIFKICLNACQSFFLFIVSIFFPNGNKSHSRMVNNLLTKASFKKVAIPMTTPDKANKRAVSRLMAGSQMTKNKSYPTTTKTKPKVQKSSFTKKRRSVKKALIAGWFAWQCTPKSRLSLTM